MVKGGHVYDIIDLALGREHGSGWRAESGLQLDSSSAAEGSGRQGMPSKVFMILQGLGSHTVTFKKALLVLASVAQVGGHHLASQEVAGSILSQGTCLG